jgi:hypothetical protein
VLDLLHELHPFDHVVGPREADAEVDPGHVDEDLCRRRRLLNDGQCQALEAR